MHPICVLINAFVTSCNMHGFSFFFILVLLRQCTSLASSAIISDLIANFQMILLPDDILGEACNTYWEFLSYNLIIHQTLLNPYMVLKVLSMGLH